MTLTLWPNGTMANRLRIAKGDTVRLAVVLQNRENESQAVYYWVEVDYGAAWGLSDFELYHWTGRHVAKPAQSTFLLQFDDKGREGWRDVWVKVALDVDMSEGVTEAKWPAAYWSAG